MKKISFILNGWVIKNDNRDLTMTQIQVEKKNLSYLYKCSPEEIDVIFKNNEIYSEFDVNVYGIYNWKDVFPKTIEGVGLNLIEGSDAHLDSILNNTLEAHLTFL